MRRHSPVATVRHDSTPSAERALAPAATARLAAAAMLAMLPVILIGFFAQRHIVKGLTVGAVKGGGRR